MPPFTTAVQNSSIVFNLHNGTFSLPVPYTKLHCDIAQSNCCQCN